MKYKLFIGCLLCCMLCASCQATQKTESESKLQVSTPKKPVLLGADKDEHGCRPSAGYSWSELLGECVRLWEVSAKIHYCKPNGNTYQAIYAIASPDSARLETYELQHMIWERKGNLPVWENKEFNKTLTRTDSIYTLNDSVSFPIWIME